MSGHFVALRGGAWREHGDLALLEDMRRVLSGPAPRLVARVESAAGGDAISRSTDVAPRGAEAHCDAAALRAVAPDGASRPAER